MERIVRSEVRETRKRVKGRTRITKKLYYLVKWVGYLDDVLIYSKMMEEHVQLVQKILHKLAQHNLAVAGHKSVFHVPETEFLGFIVNGQGMCVSDELTQSVREWATPKNLRAVRAFISFANFY